MGNSVTSCGEDGACRRAALNAYRALRDRGVIDLHAFDAAVIVFRHHHPETRTLQARNIVAEWIAPD